MTGYRVRIQRRARRELSSSPSWVQGRVAELLDDLALDPFHEDWDVAEFHGGKGFFRVRIGDYRVVYRVDEENRVVSVERVAPGGTPTTTSTPS